MRKLIFIILFFWLHLFTNAAPIGLGDKAPDFTLKDQNGNPFRLKEYIGKKVLVIYFYPKDDTPGCTKQACYFRDQYEAFTEAGAIVVGISSQDVQSHKAFAQKYNLPFTLLADEDGKVRKLYGAGDGLIPGRVTYVVDREGKVVYIFNSQSDVKRHVEEALQKVRELNR
ncbi:MAG: peroxiredoxin [Bacteroidales bacterium]|nr:peroxiredoxin [Bacteroidales bacterium]